MEYFKDEEARGARINWPHLIRNLVIDPYKNHNADIWQGFQKDGIQNAVDAINENSSESPEVWIRHISNDQYSFLIVEDYGTFGLTGVVPQEDADYDSLTNEDRWARFENIGFAKESRRVGSTLGARGQGKLMLMAASEKLKRNGNKISVDDKDRPTMLYDTLRNDGVYRFGRRQIQKFKLPLWHREGKKAEEALKAETGGLLEPLKHIGTRVIIKDPSDEVIDSLYNGQMEHTISVDWYPLLSDKTAQKRILGKLNPKYINLDLNGEIKTVKVNADLNLLGNSKEKQVKQWIRKKSLMRFDRKSYEVNFYAGCVPEGSKVISGIAGIGIYRRGMKVTSVDTPRLPPHIMDRIYGYVTVGEKLEKELEKVEDPTHYSFNDIDRGIGPAGKLKNWISDELLKFARKDLGFAEEMQEKKNLKRKKSISDALNAINNLAKKFNLTSLGTSRPDIPPSPKKVKPLRLEIKKIDFPGDAGNRRVNYGEKMRNIGCDIVNETEEPIFGRMNICAQIGKMTLVDIYEEEGIEIGSGESIGSQFCDLSINPEDFQDEGRYFIKYTFTLEAGLETLDMREGEMISRKQEFWVETDPLVKGIFKEIKDVSYDDDYYKHFTGQALSDKGGWIFEVNTKHPRYEDVNPAMLTEYIAQIALPWLMYIDVHDNDLEDRQILDFDIGNEENLINLIRTQGKLQHTFFGVG